MLHRYSNLAGFTFLGRYCVGGIPTAILSPLISADLSLAILSSRVSHSYFITWHRIRFRTADPCRTMMYMPTSPSLPCVTDSMIKDLLGTYLTWYIEASFFDHCQF